MLKKKVGCCCARARLPARSDQGSLELFLLHFFVSKQKSGKHKQRCLLRSVTLLTAMLSFDRRTMTTYTSQNHLQPAVKSRNKNQHEFLKK
jgi:hypothetical protein